MSRVARLVIALMGCFVFSLVALAQTPQGPVKVTIRSDKKGEAAEPGSSLPLDTTLRVQAMFQGSMTYGLTADGIRLTFSTSARMNFKIDGQTVFPGANGQPLPPGKDGKNRVGQISVFQATPKIKITHIMEVVPGLPAGKQAGQKRKMDTLLIRCLIENSDTVPHTVGARVRIDTYCGGNDGCLFASPEKFPNKILDGIELKGKDMPDYLMILEQPNLQNPGKVGYFTFRCGAKLEGPTRAVLTAHALGDNGWDVPAQQANGDSDVAFFWDPVAIPPGGKREVAYAHGAGLSSGPASLGEVNLEFGGSFEPGKAFTLAAYVSDPIDGQTLTLELPDGMERLEGKDVQPVPLHEGSATSMVLWKVRVARTGTYDLRVRSSNGVVHSRNITIEAQK